MKRILGLGVLALLMTSSSVEARPSSQSGFTAKVTSYCLQGMTRSGTQTRPGVIAVDPSWIPLGASVQIEGLSRIYTAEDTGGGVIGPHIDLWQESCDDAWEWGVRYRDIIWWR